MAQLGTLLPHGRGPPVVGETVGTVSREGTGLSPTNFVAALSVPLNIAEAAGRTTEADGARHYAIARGSAMECAAFVDALHVLRFIDDAAHAEAIELVARVVAMTTKLCR